MREAYRSAREFLERRGLGPDAILWVGSGISLGGASGLPLVGPVVGALLEWLAGPIGANEQDLFLGRQTAARMREGGADPVIAKGPGGPPFEAVMGDIAVRFGSVVDAYLSGLYPDAGHAQPNANHMALAGILQLARAHLVVTTNFDECIEAAAAPPGGVTVPISGAFDPPAQSLVKLHGTISRPDTLAATAAGLSQRRSSRAWQDSLASMLAGRDVVMVGYGMRDWFDIHPSLAIAAAHGARLATLDQNVSHKAVEVV